MYRPTRLRVPLTQQREPSEEELEQYRLEEEEENEYYRQQEAKKNNGHA